MRRRDVRLHGLMVGVTLCLAIGLGGCDWLISEPTPDPIPDPNPPASEGQTVVGVVQTSGVPYVELADGRTFPLDPIPDWEEAEERFSPSGGLSALQRTRPMDIPDTVDLRGHQTAIKTQWGGTCVQFALTAAVEARYHHRIDAPILDLSERFGQLLQKMSHLTEELQPQPACRENQLGAWGGGCLVYQLELFSRYALPLETELPYSAIVDPMLDWEASRCGLGTNQDAMDDYNLDPVNLPISALTNAKYSLASYVLCPDELLSSPGWYEGVMAGGHEVIFSAIICGEDPTPDNGVWDPGTGGECGGHAMLMVGYRHEERVFIVKNSWGYNAEHGEAGFTLMSYDWVEGRHIDEAGFIVSVRADNPAPQDYRFLGRWNLNHDGWAGMLDIYRLSELFPTSAIHGEVDRRLGTYWGNDGIARRVNGTIDGHEISFWIDWDAPNLDYGDLQGLHFTGYVFKGDPGTFAGTVIDNRDGQTYPFYATKDAFLVGTAAPGGIHPGAYLGQWQMSHDGWDGTLVLSDLEPVWQTSPTQGITGTYTPEGGSPVAVIGKIPTGNPREIWFDIGFPGGPQAFHGYLLSHDSGVLAGTTLSQGTPYGFVAKRTGSAGPTSGADAPM